MIIEDKVLEILQRLPHAEGTMRPNFRKIPVTSMKMTQENATIFNAIYQYMRNNYKKLTRTPSGGISYGRCNFIGYDVQTLSSMVEMTILIAEGMWRIQFRQGIDNPATRKEYDGKIYGRNAFNYFKELLLKHNIDLDDYAIENGWEVKQTIPSAPIGVYADCILHKTIEHVNHIDFHNSYPAGLCNTHPEFRHIVEHLYKHRKDHADYKAVLNFSIGFMQSKLCGYKWAHLSKDAITDNNRRIAELTQQLREAGRVILLYNTDGIYYSGAVYHGPGEGDGLGEWSNDHVDITFRCKSNGAYEFIENGKYYPVLRGSTKLDQVKPRSEWEWGDIYNHKCKVIRFYWDENEGLIAVTEK